MRLPTALLGSALAAAGLLSVGAQDFQRRHLGLGVPTGGRGYGYHADNDGRLGLRALQIDESVDSLSLSLSMGDEVAYLKTGAKSGKTSSGKTEIKSGGKSSKSTPPEPVPPSEECTPVDNVPTGKTGKGFFGGKTGKSSSEGKSSKSADDMSFSLSLSLSMNTGKSGKSGDGDDSGKSGKSDDGPGGVTKSGKSCDPGKVGKSKAGKSTADDLDCDSDKLLAIAFDLIEPLGPDTPFGTIDSPADVTDLCYFEPPEKPIDNNLGCPFLYIPGMDEGDPGLGFLTTEEDYMEFLGEEAGEAFWALVLYCQCFQGLELGCAAKIPHGLDVEYCKMVGVWNGDFDSDVAQEFTPEVMDCGCYFTGQAKDMVSQCPGVDLGAYFVFPEGSGTDAPTTTGPTPTPGAFFDSFEEDETFFPNDPWFLDSGDFADAIKFNDMDEGDVRKLSRKKKGQMGRRRLQGGDWARTDDVAFEGEYSIKSPDYGGDTSTSRYATVYLDATSFDTPGTLTFALKTDFPNNDVNSIAWYIDDFDGFQDEVETMTDWQTYDIDVPGGTDFVIWDYIYDGDEAQGTAYIDEVKFSPESAPIPSPTVSDVSLYK